MKSIRKKRVIYKSLTLLLSVIFFSILLSGCFLTQNYVKKIEFNVNSIILNLGDEIDLYDYLTIEPENTAAEIVIISGNENIVSANYALTLKALSIGKTHIKAVAGKKESNCSVEVRYKDLDSIRLFSYGDLFQPSDDTSPVDFSAETTDYVRQNYEINWYINDVKQSINGKYFSFTPENDVEDAYNIVAKVKDTEISDSIAIGVYNRLSGIPFVTALETADNNYSFSSETEGDWKYRINGELIYSDSEKGDWEFVPSKSGIYCVTASIFGEPVIFDNGEYEHIIYKKGNIVPSNLTFEYDNCYPDSFLSWELENVFDDSVFDYHVKITDSSGDTREFSSQTHSQLFDGTTFNSSGLIDITKKYTIGVSCEYGDMFPKGQYTSIENEVIPSSALPFLNKKFLDKNYYITDDKEFFDVYEYTLWTRAEAAETKNSIFSNLTVYMAYNSENNVQKLARLAWARSAQAGLYYLGNPSGNTKKGSTLSIKITYASDNSPSKTTNLTTYSTPILKPHINYGEKSNRELYIEKLPLTKDKISNSNELFYVIEKGFRPNIKADSKAEELYNYAKNILQEITSDDMNELDKIHAIYDWILWRTHYDKAVINVASLEESVKYAAYYLESVLTDSYPFSVCDGLSKTFSLLCNMEGIKCVRVVGKADSGNNNWGEHAWNKVFLDGGWFLVDCTWGDYEITINGKNYESGSHQFLMLSKGELSSTHRENALGGYPETSVKPFMFFRRQFSHNGTSADLYIFSESDIPAKVEAIVNYILAAKPESDSYTIGGGEYNKTDVVFYGTDFMVPSYLTLKVENAITNVLQTKNVTNYVITSVSGKYMYILIRY